MSKFPSIPKTYLSRRDEKSITRIATTNHVGKMKKKRGKANSENNHNKPKNFVKRGSSINYGSQFGLTDEQYEVFIKTGQLPS